MTARTTPAPESRVAMRTSASRRRLGGGDRRAVLLFASPALASFGLFMIVPLLGVFWLSTQNWSGLLSTPTFNGLDNFVELLSDRTLQIALTNTVLQVVVELVLVMVLGYMLGYFLSLKARFSGLLLSICLIPILLSTAARALMFVGVLQPNGLLNGALELLGLGAVAQPWLGSTSTALGVIIGVDVWGALGFTAVMVSARLSDLPLEIKEAAALDGANEWTVMWRVALPIVTPFLGTLAILHFTWALMSSAQNVLLLTNGGPGTSSMNLAFMMYEAAFVTNQLGYSQAIGVLLIVLGVAGMAGLRYLSRDRT